MTVIGEAVAAVFIIAGSLVSILSAVGVLRFPDVYTRAHAASKSSALGVLFSLTGAFLYFGLVHNFISIRLLLAIFFVFLTAPVGAHVVLRAAHHSGVELAGINPRDDLKDDTDCSCSAGD